MDLHDPEDGVRESRPPVQERASEKVRLNLTRTNQGGGHGGLTRRAGDRSAGNHLEPAALVLHMAYWKYAVTRHFTGAPRGSFPREPANFPAVPDHPDAGAWTLDRHLLRDQHEALCRAARALGDVRPHDPVPSKPRWSWLQLLEGIHMHDTYHTGQIQIMKRLHASLGED